MAIEMILDTPTINALGVEIDVDSNCNWEAHHFETHFLQWKTLPSMAVYTLTANGIFYDENFAFGYCSSFIEGGAELGDKLNGFDLWAFISGFDAGREVINRA